MKLIYRTNVSLIRVTTYGREWHIFTFCDIVETRNIIRYKEQTQSMYLVTICVYMKLTRWERLGQLFSFLSIINNESVQVARATDLKFGLVAALLDFHRAGVLAASLLEEITDVINLLWHFWVVENKLVLNATHTQQDEKRQDKARKRCLV